MLYPAEQPFVYIPILSISLIDSGTGKSVGNSEKFRPGLQPIFPNPPPIRAGRPSSGTGSIKSRQRRFADSPHEKKGGWRGGGISNITRCGNIRSFDLVGEKRHATSSVEKQVRMRKEKRKMEEGELKRLNSRRERIATMNRLFVAPWRSLCVIRVYRKEQVVKMRLRPPMPGVNEGGEGLN